MRQIREATAARCCSTRFRDGPALAGKAAARLQERVIGPRRRHAAVPGRHPCHRDPTAPVEAVRAGRSARISCSASRGEPETAAAARAPSRRDRARDPFHQEILPAQRRAACARLGRRHAAPRAQPLPGNVRELENTIHRAVLLTTGARSDGRHRDAGRPAGSTRPRTRGRGACHVRRRNGDARAGRAHVADVERDLILETLKHCLGNPPTPQHPSHLDPHAAQQAQRIRRRRRADPTARRRREARAA